MIGSLELSYVYISPPKTGTMSFRSWFTKYFQGETIAVTHEATIPEEYRKVATPIMSVRNPYERCLSLWWWSCMAPEREAKCHLYGCSFVTYMHRLLWHRDHPDATHQTPNVYMNLAMYANRIEEQTGKRPVSVALEDPALGLRSLPFVTTEGQLGALRKARVSQRPRVDRMKFFSGVEEDLVWQYCQEDFEAFGYSRLPRRDANWRTW